jgi:RNA polymerase sigma factor (sigma-70 family)
LTLTDEQLIGFIKQGGNDELIPVLWERVKKLLYLLAGRYYRLYAEFCSVCGVELADLRQAAYIAYIKSLSTFEPECGCKYSTYLKYPYKAEIKALFDRTEPLNCSDSLNAPAFDTEGADIERGELIPDISAEEQLRSIEERSESEYMRRSLRECIAMLEPIQRQVIHLHYYRNLSMTETARRLNISRSRAETAEHHALTRLRGFKKIREIGNNLGYSSSKMYENSYKTFIERGLTGAEYIAISRADITMNMK